MLRVLPDWTMELEEKLDKVIKDLAVKNHIDLVAVEDSKAIDDAKSAIMNSLVRLYENYAVEDRKRLEEFEKDMKETEKRLKGKVKNDNK